MSERDEQEAAELVRALEQFLTTRGYDFVAISIAKFVRTPDGHCATPGAATLAANRRMAPALPHEARTLRLLADKLDAMFAESGSSEAEESIVEDATRTYYTTEGQPR